MGEMDSKEYWRQNEDASELCEMLVKEADKRRIHPIILYSHLLILTSSYEKLLLEEGMLTEKDVAMIKAKAEEAVKQNIQKH
jgi:ElaB/YqjD/DUF883 family membrane-anchored ribosome-binding protein